MPDNNTAVAYQVPDTMKKCYQWGIRNEIRLESINKWFDFLDGKIENECSISIEWGTSFCWGTRLGSHAGLISQTWKKPMKNWITNNQKDRYIVFCSFYFFMKMVPWKQQHQCNQPSEQIIYCINITRHCNITSVGNWGAGGQWSC